MSSKEPATVTAARITRTGAIIAALIALAGVLIAAVWQSIGKPGGTLPPTPLPETNSLVIEQIPFTVYPFDGNDDPSCCVGQAYFEYTIDKNLIPIYGLDYILPENDPRFGFAGIAFVFEQPQDFSKFDTLSFNARFGETVDQLDVSLEDITLTEAYFHLSGNASEESDFILPIRNFKDVNQKAIRAIKFQVKSSYASRTNWIDISRIRLTAKGN